MSKTVNTKCRAKGGPAYCADPNCPERNHRAAREAQAKNSFMDSVLKTVGLKNEPSSLVQYRRDELDATNTRIDKLISKIEDPTERAAAEARVAKPIVSRNGDINFEELNRLANRVEATKPKTFELGNVELPYDTLIEVTNIAKKHNLTATRGGTVTSGPDGDIRVLDLKFHGTKENLDAARNEMSTLLNGKLEQIARSRELRQARQAKPQTHRFPRSEDPKTWDAIENFGGGRF